MVMIVNKRAGAVLAVAAGLCVAASLPALSQGFGPRSEGDERGYVESQRPQDERGEGERPQGFGFHVEKDEHGGPRGFGFRFEGDERGNIEGKRASCEVYSKIAQVQVEANRKYNCGYNGPRWGHDLEQHFRWCRHVRREAVITEVRERGGELQRCFDRLGDFDEEATDDRR